MALKIQEPYVNVTDQVFNKKSIPNPLESRGYYSGSSSSGSSGSDSSFNPDNYYTKSQIDNKFASIEMMEYVAGENISISGSHVISATDTTYQASDFDISDLSDQNDLKSTWNNKQDQLTAGENISIENDTISAIIPDPDLSDYYTKDEVDTLISNVPDTTYSAGSNINIDANNEISADLSDYYDKSEINTKFDEHEYTAGPGISITNRAISCTLNGIKQVDLNNYISNKNGEIVQNIGSTTQYYIHGYIYENVDNSWELIDVQPSNQLTAGSNITIDNGVISATDTTYTASDFDIKDLSDSTNLKSTWNSKQDQLVAGNNITIVNNEISASQPDLTDYATKQYVDSSVVTYTAGDNITIENNVISADIDLSDLQTRMSDVESSLNDKVDKVSGKNLSSNDYTDADKLIVDGVTNSLANKVDKVSGKGLSTNDYTDADKLIVDGVTSSLSNKVDKVSGKLLSTNDFTDSYKNKLDGIESGANNYSLPTASANTLGGIKVGNNLSIDANGVLSAIGSSITIDSQLSSTSENAVQNKVLYDELRITETSSSFQKFHYQDPNYDSYWDIDTYDVNQLDTISFNGTTAYILPDVREQDDGETAIVANIVNSEGKIFALPNDLESMFYKFDSTSCSIVTGDGTSSQISSFLPSVTTSDFVQFGTDEPIDDGEYLFYPAVSANKIVGEVIDGSVTKSLKQKIAELERGDNLWASVID